MMPANDTTLRRGSDGKFEFSIDSGITCLESGPAAPGGRG